MTSMPFEDNYFDVAHCHAVLMHVPYTTAVLAKVKRVLKPGGHHGQPRVHYPLVFPRACGK